jgi:peptide deformylase
MVCEPVRDSEYGEKLEKFANQLTSIMGMHGGVGLAAPQIGTPIRVFAMKFRVEPIVVCNPTLILAGPTAYEREGCLSLPEIFEQVARAQTATMRYFTPTGVEKELELAGMDARIAQHEDDHLSGIMFPSRLSRQMKKATLQNWEKIKHKYVR